MLDLAQARTSPCHGCRAECCSVLPLRDFQINTLADLDWAMYLLSFEGIELSVVDSGVAGSEAWQVSMHTRCRNLTDAHLCAVHDTALQPAICKRFNPYACSYRRIYQQNEARYSLRMDRDRMAIYASMLGFNEGREIVSRPAFADLVERASALPLPDGAPARDDEPADGRDRWEADARAGAPDPAPAARSWADLADPCGGCAAWCCTRLFIPMTAPSNAQNLDYFRFLLGFPNLEIGLGTDGAWTAIVRTRCRHLIRDAASGAGRCGLIGRPERPMICTYYDATGCAYREHFGQPRPRGMVRVRYTEFDTLAELFRFDACGYITDAPDAASLREAMEARWRAEGIGP